MKKKGEDRDFKLYLDVIVEDVCRVLGHRHYPVADTLILVIVDFLVCALPCLLDLKSYLLVISDSPLYTHIHTHTHTYARKLPYLHVDCKAESLARTAAIDYFCQITAASHRVPHISSS